MIIQCSKCLSRFLAPDQAIGAKGRTVRCGKCAHTWFQSPAPDYVAPVVPDLDAMISEVNTRRPKPIPKGSNLPATAGKLASLRQMAAPLVLSLVAFALLLLFISPGVFGVPSSKGLVLADVGVVRVTNKDKHVSFLINGKIANTTAHTMKVPTLRVTLIDKDGKSLQYWDFTGDSMTINPGKDVPFATGDLAVRFESGTRFVAELGSPLELALRRKPEPVTTPESQKP